jgi:hypothetical protein
MMIKKILFIISFLALFSSISFSVNFLDLDVSCEGSDCIPGQTTDWNTTISNLGNTRLKVLGYKVIDAVSKKIIIHDEDEKAIFIVPTKNHSFLIREQIPSPNKEGDLIVNVCIITEPETESWGTVGKRIEYCYEAINFTFTLTGCLETMDCKEDEVCIDQTCSKLNCSYCQYPQAHLCNDYKCCEDYECKLNEICTDHECIKLECTEDTYIINHTCSTCDENKTMVNYFCYPLKCEYDEYRENNECLKVECTDYEHPVNHTCKNLTCSYNEAFIDHSCVELECKYDEYPFNHSCENLKCNFLQKTEEHECRFRSIIILEFFILFVIFFLIRLNVKKYDYIKNRKLGKYLAKKVKKRENIKTEEENKDNKEDTKDE